MVNCNTKQCLCTYITTNINSIETTLCNQCYIIMEQYFVTNLLIKLLTLEFVGSLRCIHGNREIKSNTHTCSFLQKSFNNITKCKSPKCYKFYINIDTLLQCYMKNKHMINEHKQSI